jgi:glycosyltransferase involved in cell wall biosynthesis
LKLLQVSSAHVYLTYPFVLSWSCVEAMAAGCVLIGSDTRPVREVIDHGRNGVLVDFHDSEAVADAVIDVLSSPKAYAHMGVAARETVLSRFDKHECVARAVEFVRSIGSARAPEIHRNEELAVA